MPVVGGPPRIRPFAENAIKHGAQSTNEQSKIDIAATIRNTTLNFSVINSKPSIISDNARKGTGLENVKRRLTLLYPDAHTLDIMDKENEYIVNLTIDLTV